MDIYFTEEYGKLCEKIEGGVCETFNYRINRGEIHHMFIKRPIPQIVDGKQYYDLMAEMAKGRG